MTNQNFLDRQPNDGDPRDCKKRMNSIPVWFCGTAFAHGECVVVAGAGVVVGGGGGAAKSTTRKRYGISFKRNAGEATSSKILN